MQALAAGFGGFVGEAQAGEAGEVGLGEVELAQGGEVEGEVPFGRRRARGRRGRRGWAGACR